MYDFKLKKKKKKKELYWYLWAGVSRKGAHILSINLEITMLLLKVCVTVSLQASLDKYQRNNVATLRRNVGRKTSEVSWWCSQTCSCKAQW